MEKGYQDKVAKALASIRKITTDKPKLGVVLGSGLSGVVDAIEGLSIPYSAIDGFPEPTVEGHKGLLKIGKDVVIFAGRFHYYEGYSISDVVLPIFLMQALGVHTVLLTNAAGGIHPSYTPGDLVFITDHINLQYTNPLMGPNNPDWGPRFADMSEVYSKELRTQAHQVAHEAVPSRVMKEGVYAAFTGPTYETPAEIRMLSTLGADLIGMSTVPEATAANYLGMKVAAISCVTNLAAGISISPLNHEEVVETGKMVQADMTSLIQALINRWT